MSAFKIALLAIAAFIVCSVNAQKGPTISFISPNVISDIGKQKVCLLANHGSGLAFKS